MRVTGITRFPFHLLQLSLPVMKNLWTLKKQEAKKDVGKPKVSAAQIRVQKGIMIHPSSHV
jgi:hypothetical protein